MTLGEFAKVCWKDPELRDLWQRLWDLSFGLVDEKLQKLFEGQHEEVTTVEFKKALEFKKVKEALEKACRSRGIVYPDLSITAFARQHLRYKQLRAVPQTTH